MVVVMEVEVMVVVLVMEVEVMVVEVETLTMQPGAMAVLRPVTPRARLPPNVIWRPPQIWRPGRLPGSPVPKTATGIEYVATDGVFFGY